MTPRDLFIFSRRSALARPSEPVPFVFRSVTYTLFRWVHACEAIARPPARPLPLVRYDFLSVCASVRIFLSVYLATMRPSCPLAHPGSVTKYERSSMSFAQSYITSLMYTSVLTAGPAGRSYAVFG